MTSLTEITYYLNIYTRAYRGSKTQSHPLSIDIFLKNDSLLAPIVIFGYSRLHYCTIVGTLLCMKERV